LLRDEFLRKVLARLPLRFRSEALKFRSEARNPLIYRIILGVPSKVLFLQGFLATLEISEKA
jgi:hypothetical protein